MESASNSNDKEHSTFEKVSISTFAVPTTPTSAGPSTPDAKPSTSPKLGSSLHSDQIAGPSRGVLARPRVIYRIPRPRMSANGLRAKAYVAKVTALNRKSRSKGKNVSADEVKSEKPSPREEEPKKTENGEPEKPENGEPEKPENGEPEQPSNRKEEPEKPRPKRVFPKKKRRKYLVRPPSRVARARILFPDAKYTIVREAVMPENVPAKVYYHLMGKSFVNLRDILNKTINLKINSPSPCIPYREKKRRSSSGGGNSSRMMDKPSKKAKKIII